MWTRISDEQWVEIHSRVLAGEDPRDFDKQLGYAAGGVARMLNRRFGYKRRPKRAPLTWAETDQIHERVERGENLSAIAREMGLYSSANLYKIMMRRYGYTSEQVRYRPVWAPTIRIDEATDTDLAYIAGIVDGEGSIMKILRNAKYPVWALKVNMTDRPLIEWLHSHGGTFSVRPSRDPERWKEQYEWKMHRQLDVQAMLTALLPYLRVKRDKALEALNDFATTQQALRCDWTPEEADTGFSQRRPVA